MSKKPPGWSNSTPRLVIGLTGNIASGKSTVVGMLTELGATAIDADSVYHELIAPQRPLWHALRSRFGEGIIAGDGTIDRRSLGAIVFSDQQALADLDDLTHPAVNAEIEQRVDAASGVVVVIDAVKLIESGGDAICDQVWVVVAKPEQQLLRLMSRNDLSRADAERRIAAQPPLGPKLNHADVVINNTGEIDCTRRQVERIWRERVEPMIG